MGVSKQAAQKRFVPKGKVLAMTFREALRLGHNYIGTAHLLLAPVSLTR